MKMWNVECGMWNWAAWRPSAALCAGDLNSQFLISNSKLSDEGGLK